MTAWRRVLRDSWKQRLWLCSTSWSWRLRSMVEKGLGITVIMGTVWAKRTRCERSKDRSFLSPFFFEYRRDFANSWSGTARLCQQMAKYHVPRLLLYALNEAILMAHWAGVESHLPNIVLWSTVCYGLLSSLCRQ